MIVRSRPARLIPFVLAFVLGVGAAALTACGGAENKAMIPAQNADQLHQHLNALRDAVDSGNCTDVTRALAQAQADVQELPNGVSVRLRNRLQEGIDRLKTQAPHDCQQNTTTTDTTPTTTTAVTTATTPPTVTTVPTTPTTTTPTTTTPTTTPTTPATTTSSSDTGGVTIPGD